MESRSTPHALAVVSLLTLAALACSTLLGTPAVTPTAPAPATAVAPGETPPASPAPDVSPLPPQDVFPAAFATYPDIQISYPPVFPGGYTLPVDLAGAQGLIDLELSAGQQALLSENGFVVAPPEPGQYREFYQIYEQSRYSDRLAFITSDSVFHIYHLIFDKMLRDLEREKFIPALETLTQTMLAASAEQYASLQGTSLEEPARRNAAFFGVAARLLGLPDAPPAPASDLVEAELALIDAHGGPQVSPLWDRDDLPNDKKLIEDYSQYIPRGHYTRSEELKRYFLGMMWYGRLTFRLRDDFETRRALLLTQALRTATAPDGRPAADLWEGIYDPTVFIVGKADDLSYHEYGALSDAVFGPSAGPEAYGDDALLAQFNHAARGLPTPQVNSMWVWIWEDRQEATQGFRFMGQRFTLDEYVFGQLIWRKVGTEAQPRGLPQGLDFFAALGSDEALNILAERGETDYAHYSEQMDKVRGEIANLQQDSWTQNLYWAWLYAFQPIIEPKDTRYPAFMQTGAWTRKDLNTALGSWTELKHDTILYAKQVLAEMGGGGPQEPPRGYVEPNPEAFARLLALAQMTSDGLSSRNLLTDTTSANLANLIDMLAFLKATAERELNGQPIPDDDYWRIKYFGGELEALTIAASDCEGAAAPDCRDLQDQKAALVADVASGLLPDGSLAALEEAIGQPTEIYVVLPDEPLRVAVGAVYTYYEFTVPPGGRLTDEQWQAQVESGDTPPAPEWTALFVSP
jgi:hypothetical protein